MLQLCLWLCNHPSMKNSALRTASCLLAFTSATLIASTNTTSANCAREALEIQTQLTDYERRLAAWGKLSWDNFRQVRIAPLPVTHIRNVQQIYSGFIQQHLDVQCACWPPKRKGNELGRCPA